MSEAERSIQRIVVLGGGSAGLLAALGLARGLPEAEIVVVRSTKMGVIGVGEGTIPSVVQFLHKFLAIDLGTFNREVQPSIKLGIKYLWGRRPFFHYTFSPQLEQRHPRLPYAKGYFCDDDFEFADLNAALMRHDRVSVRAPDGRPRLNQSFAYHLENRRLVGYFEKLADEWGILKIDAVVDRVEEGPRGVAALHLDDGQRIEGDLFIDCSGFRAELIGKVLEEPFVDFSESLFCDRAVAGGWARTGEDAYHPFTTAETMDAGWAWKIEHDEIVNRGYVFCSSFLTDEQAIEEFCRKNPKVESPRVIRFRAGVHRRTWVGNVVAIGNAAGFVEPIEATAIGVICDSVSRLARGLKASNLRLLDIQRKIYNRIVFKNWEIIRDFLAMHYRFNDRLDTPFWRQCLHEVQLGDAQELVDYYREVGPDFGFLKVELQRDFFTAEGYLTMLLGQRVPYRRKVEIDDRLRGDWNRFKGRLSEMAGAGIAMPEYLRTLRSLGNGQRAGQRASQADPLAPQGGHKASGELHWH